MRSVGVCQALRLYLGRDLPLSFSQAIAHLGDYALANHGRQRLPFSVYSRVLLREAQRGTKFNKN